MLHNNNTTIFNQKIKMFGKFLSLTAKNIRLAILVNDYDKR